MLPYSRCRVSRIHLDGVRRLDRVEYSLIVKNTKYLYSVLVHRKCPGGEDMVVKMMVGLFTPSSSVWSWGATRSNPQALY